MNILITGVPGTGKSEISKALAKKLKLKVINDKEFSRKNNLGKEKTIDSSKEYVVDITKLNNYFKKTFKEKTIYEGHLWGELSSANLSRFDMVFVIVVSKKLLIERQKKRGYTDIKIIENVFCQDVKYIQNTLKVKNIPFKIIKANNNLNQIH